jgi:hypothetical protein
MPLPGVVVVEGEAVVGVVMGVVVLEPGIVVIGTAGPSTQ